MYISFGRVNFNFRRIFKQIINKRFEFECKYSNVKSNNLHGATRYPAITDRYRRTFAASSSTILLISLTTRVSLISA